MWLDDFRGGFQGKVELELVGAGLWRVNLLHSLSYPLVWRPNCTSMGTLSLNFNIPAQWSKLVPTAR
jgi:hypothetical protein